jgi:hypothetical protein
MPQWRRHQAAEPSMPLHLLWNLLQAQGDMPIHTDAARFVAGWSGLKVALGADRAAEIAAALGF